MSISRNLKLLIFVALVLVSNIISAQSSAKKALEKGNKAVSLMDKGEFSKSIALLEEAKKLDPGNISYPYEIAYAHYLQKEYKKALKIVKKLIKHKDAKENHFQMLGNLHDVLGDSEKAFEAYDKGLEKFPNSGIIHLEKGNVHWGKKEYNKALNYYEKGIEVDPNFPSNYYRATRIYCGSTEEVWGLIYGEIFMNLEPNSERTAEISKLLFDVYKSEITFSDSSSSASVSFCQQMSLALEDISDPSKFRMPFCMIYEPTLIIGVAFVNQITIATLDTIRKTFSDTYISMGHSKSHPNVLFEFHDKLIKAGHFEAYNYFILMKGDDFEFKVWYENNKMKWDTFVAWYGENSLAISTGHCFYTSQY
jgi:tetratricopeptide (TPR) repeat protein